MFEDATIVIVACCACRSCFTRCCMDPSYIIFDWPPSFFMFLILQLASQISSGLCECQCLDHDLLSEDAPLSRGGGLHARLRRQPSLLANTLIMLGSSTFSDHHYLLSRPPKRILKLEANAHTCTFAWLDTTERHSRSEVVEELPPLPLPPQPEAILTQDGPLRGASRACRSAHKARAGSSRLDSACCGS